RPGRGADFRNVQPAGRAEFVHAARGRHYQPDERDGAGYQDPVNAGAGSVAERVDGQSVTPTEKGGLLWVLPRWGRRPKTRSRLWCLAGRWPRPTSRRSLTASWTIRTTFTRSGRGPLHRWGGCLFQIGGI